MKVKVFFLSLLFLFLQFPALSFAADVTLSGKIFDQKSNPIPGGIVIFSDTSGKTIKAVTADTNGFYKTSLIAGTYSIAVDGPRGANMEEKKYANTTITSSTTMDFTLTSPPISEAKKSTRNLNLLLAVLTILLLITLLVYFFWRKKEELPQPSSSN